jgi:alkanesulfonate monooxygenase SsuD/methylene tetrahydromethanopterin reductase-like flavin-dependent oxidoreductase (luciferase family)
VRNDTLLYTDVPNDRGTSTATIQTQPEDAASMADDPVARPLAVMFNLDRTAADDVEGIVDLAAEAVDLGYDGAWVTGRSPRPFEVTDALGPIVAGADRDVQVGISVIPIGAWPSPVALAAAAATSADRSAGRFALGVGVGHPAVDPTEYGERDRRPIGFARAYVEALRTLLAGGRHDGGEPFFASGPAELGRTAPPVPIYLGALGPRMIELGGATADGVILNWATAGHVAWSAGVVEEGASAAGRDPAAVTLMTQIRVCIDDDVDRARRALARQLIGMVIRTPIERPDRGYRAHARRLGFGDLFDALATRRERGASYDELAAAIPAEVIDALAYAGPPAGAPAAVRRLAGRAGVALIRPVPTSPGPQPGRRALLACRPA